MIAAGTDCTGSTEGAPMAEQPVVVLLHGLGANRHVWDGVAGLLRADGVMVYVPDIRGHGEAPWRKPYTFGAMAADVAEALQRNHRGTPYIVAGHSMGGVVGLALASGWFGPPPQLAATIGVKLRWSAEEVGRIAELASRPPREFGEHADAVEWFMKLAGLHRVVETGDERIGMAIETGVMRSDSERRLSADHEPAHENSPDSAAGWCVAQDPATVGVGPPDVTGLLAAAKCQVVMALGRRDPVVTPEHHRDLATSASANPLTVDVTTPHVFDGLGHNAMVEDPQAVADWLAALSAP